MLIEAVKMKSKTLVTSDQATVKYLVREILNFQFNFSNSQYYKFFLYEPTDVSSETAEKLIRRTNQKRVYCSKVSKQYKKNPNPTKETTIKNQQINKKKKKKNPQTDSQVAIHRESMIK